MLNESYSQANRCREKMNWTISVDETKEGHAPLRILLTGPMSGSVGGVSVHLNRLRFGLHQEDIAVELVDESRHIEESIYNLRSKRIMPYLRRLRRCNIAHIQSSVHIFRWLHVVASRCFGLYVVVTIHSWRSSRIVTILNKLFLRLAHRIIVVNDDIGMRLRLRTYEVIPAFLPPARRTGDLPVEIKQFIASARNQGCSVLCANASKLTEYQGEDLYGLDLCIKLINNLTYQTDINAALVFVVTYPAANNPIYINARKLILQRGLKARICLYNKSVDFVSLMTLCNVVLRPTMTDGDALTVREALYLGLPVVASDSAKRPEGTIVFRNRDVVDFADRTIAAINGEANVRKVSRDNDHGKELSKYVNLYRTVSGSLIPG